MKTCAHIVLQARAYHAQKLAENPNYDRDRKAAYRQRKAASMSPAERAEFRRDTRCKAAVWRDRRHATLDGLILWACVQKFKARPELAEKVFGQSRCEICAKCYDFKRTGGRQKLCSKKCRGIDQWRKTIQPFPTKVCPRCGWIHQSRQSDYCSGACSRWALRHRASDQTTPQTTVN